MLLGISGVPASVAQAATNIDTHAWGIGGRFDPGPPLSPVSQESAKKSWQVANQTLRPDENVIAATKARRFPAGDRGVLIVSDERLLFVHARGYATATEEIPFGNITGVVNRKGWIRGGIKVTAAGGITTIFHGISGSRLPSVMEAIQSHLTRFSAPTRRPSSPQSSAEEIKKLAELRDSGILTEEEFLAKKRQILGM